MEAGEYVAWFAIAADESVAAGAAYPKNLVAVDFSDNLALATASWWLYEPETPLESSDD